jgi:hypothetical protein
MSVWYCIPSKRPPEEAEKCLKLWRERGYKIALWSDTRQDAEAKRPDWWQANSTDYHGSTDTYPGYASAVNHLVRCVLEFDHEAEWLVTGGDDIEPDANHSAEEIARECSEYFWHYFDAEHRLPTLTIEQATTFGVMQPTGDRYGADERHLGERGSAYIDRVCGSPWMGREFCRRMYQGNGPLFEGYFHMGEDEELQAVATKLGVLWQRPDLIHFHRHWARKNKDRADMPKFLERANSAEEWQKYKQIFAERKTAGFPGSEPLEA